MNAELHWMDVTTELNGSFIKIINQTEIVNCFGLSLQAEKIRSLKFEDNYVKINARAKSFLWGTVFLVS